MQATAFSGQALARRGLVAFAPAPVRRGALVVQNAHKKGAGSTKNGRDSESKRRGIKVYGGQPVRAGGIIVRQVGSTWHAGNNVDLGKDYTVFSLVDGIVVFDKKKEKPEVHVYPLDHTKAIKALQATHTKQPKEGVPCRRERRLAAYKDKPRKTTTKAELAVAQVSVSMKP